MLRSLLERTRQSHLESCNQLPAGKISFRQFLSSRGGRRHAFSKPQKPPTYKLQFGDKPHPLTLDHCGILPTNCQTTKAPSAPNTIGATPVLPRRDHYVLGRQGYFGG